MALLDSSEAHYVMNGDHVNEPARCQELQRVAGSGVAPVQAHPPAPIRIPIEPFTARVYDVTTDSVGMRRVTALLIRTYNTKPGFASIAAAHQVLDNLWIITGVETEDV